ncbi:Uncharacterized protein BM_BM8967 [Brugia malayi]|uniref:Uncharacterized protein n=1 Tax=Brugia malayi TaxID=6279 RepID=A0A4E9F0B9_BRUMA|nr:Uncharacterized protein BM_BM8967 [Brugia malayi]VIO89446.1 Uncharacterized protein BM_BM8967 [Brugia malayi]
MMQLTEVISNLTKRRTTGSDDSTTANNNEQEDMDEFVDAVDVFYEESESDIYDDNVQCIVAENDDMIEKDEILHELGLMLNSTLASDYDGANVARLNAHFFNDWKILLERQAIELGFPGLEELLKSEYMRDYVEQISSVNGVAIYGAVSKPSNEHILRRVADCKLSEAQRAEKRRIQRLLELKNPENSRNFLEGKRRILQILLDLKAYEMEFDYQTIRDEYMKRYSTSLNAAEHQRLFMNKSALKNFLRVFYREVILINDSPIRIRLRSPDIKIPEEITEDLRLLAIPFVSNLDRSSILNIVDKGTVKYSEDVIASGESISKKQTMDKETNSEDRQVNSARHNGNADEINNVMLHHIPKTCMPADTSKIISIQKNDHDKTHRKSLESVNLSEDKYTGDEESPDSSDSEVKSSKKYQRKKSRRNLNTFNMPSISSKQSVKRLPIGERSLHQSLNYSHLPERNPFSSSSISFSNKSSAGLIQRQYSSQLVANNKQYSEEYHGTQSSGYHDFVQFDRTQEEVSKLPYGSYSVPDSTSSQCISRQVNDIGNHRNSNENFEKPSANHSDQNSWTTSVQQMQPHTQSRFQEYNRGYPDDCTVLRSIPSNKFFSHLPNKEVSQLSKQTQTDEDWLENLFDELGCYNSSRNPLQKLVKVIKLLLDIRSPNPVLLSALPQLVGSFYGTPLNPAEDQNYRKTWREIVRDYCSAEILIAPLPNGEEILIKK